MSRKVRAFAEIKDYGSLDALIEKAIEIRETLPPGAEPEVRLKGDDIFGRIISISYFRPQTSEEAECDARYAEAYRVSRFGVARAPASRPILHSVA